MGSECSTSKENARVCCHHRDSHGISYNPAESNKLSLFKMTSTMVIRYTEETKEVTSTS
jgi:hypothetical protein